MRIFIIKKITLIFIISGLLCGTAISLSLPVFQVTKRLSPETREYWAGSPDIIWHVNTKNKMIALTFDDGPSPTFTPQILDILKKNNAKATFFVVAQRAEKLPDIVRRMVYEGHEVANHTYNHPYLNGITEKEFQDELALADKTLIKVTGVKPKLFRPPGGYYNEKIVRVAKEMGYRVVIWSWEQQSRDWANPGTAAIIRSVLKNAAGGNIVVFHDQGGNRTQTVQALQPIINGLKENGFKLVTVSDMYSGQ